MKIEKISFQAENSPVLTPELYAACISGCRYCIEIAEIPHKIKTHARNINENCQRPGLHWPNDERMTSIRRTTRNSAIFHKDSLWFDLFILYPAMRLSCFLSQLAVNNAHTINEMHFVRRHETKGVFEFLEIMMDGSMCVRTHRPCVGPPNEFVYETKTQ